jgi:riboflavin synthase
MIMFSGLVEATASIAVLEPEPGGVRITVRRPSNFDDVKVGDSISILGCCLTVVQAVDGGLAFQAGRETLSRTTLGRLRVGDRVNCERSLRLGDRLGGHLVTGHIDGLGTVHSRLDEAEWSDFHFSAPQNLLRQMASKGSIAVDGVSLTLVNVTNQMFSVALIPHTLANTTLGALRPGSEVNLETDLLAKYVSRQLEFATHLQGNTV